MRRVGIPLLVGLIICAYTYHRAYAGAHPHFRLGAAPKPHFKVGGRSFNIDPKAKSVARIRALPQEHFDPIARHQRVNDFYRGVFKDRYEETFKHPGEDSGPFRHEFLRWAERWPGAMRARWAWHHRQYIDDALWTQWAGDPVFANEIAVMDREKPPVEEGYMPPEYASTSPVVIYNDEFLNAAYNPMPFLAVLKLKSLKPDEKTDWIGTAAADSLEAKLSSIPGLFLAETEQIEGVARDQKLVADIAEPEGATKIGKALNLERVVTGSYVVDGDKVLVNLKIVDIENGTVQGGISKTIPRDKLLDAVPELSTAIISALGYDLETPAADQPVGNELARQDLVQPGSIWVNPDKPQWKFSIISREGTHFKADYVVRTDNPQMERIVKGTIIDGKMSWLARDTVPIKGPAGGDITGLIDGKKINCSWTDKDGKSGTFQLKLQPQ